MTGMRRIRVLAAPLAAGMAMVALVGCSSSTDQGLRTGGSPAAAPEGKVPGGRETAGPLTRAPGETGSTPELKEEGDRLTGAQLVSGDGLGWATTNAGLFVTTDAGSTWRNWRSPVAANTVAGVALLSPNRALVASSKDASAVVYSTNDAGKHWTENDLGPVLGGVADARFAYDGERIAGLLVKQGTSSNFSVASWFSTPDAGVTWRRHDAPVAGDVSASGGGTLWLAGGVTHNQLFTSSDAGATWSAVALPPQLTANPLAFDAPAQTSTGLTLAVTVPEGDTTSVVALTSGDDGQTWSETSRTQLSESVGTGVRVPASVGGDTLLVAAASGEEHGLPLTGGGASKKVSPRGLPAGVSRLDLATDQLGWAEFSSTSCRAPRTDCTRTSGLVVTRDGGESWQPTSPIRGS